VCTRALSLACTRALSHVCTYARPVQSRVAHSWRTLGAHAQWLLRSLALPPPRWGSVMQRFKSAAATRQRSLLCARACTAGRTLGKKCCLASGHMRSRERAHAPLPCLMRVQRDSARPKRAAPSACNNATAAPPMRASLSPASPRVAPRACGAGARAGRALPPSEWRLPGLQIERLYGKVRKRRTNFICSWIVPFQRKVGHVHWLRSSQPAGGWALPPRLHAGQARPPGLAPGWADARAVSVKMLSRVACTPTLVGLRQRKSGGGACEAVAAALPPGGGTSQLPINNLGGCAWANARARTAVRADYLRLVRRVHGGGGGQQLGTHYHPLLPVSRSARILQCRAVPTPICRHPSTMSAPAAALVAMLALHAGIWLHLGRTIVTLGSSCMMCAGTTPVGTRPSAAARTTRMATRATSTAPTPDSAR
jgi:hypothetical protein